MSVTVKRITVYPFWVTISTKDVGHDDMKAWLDKHVSWSGKLFYIPPHMTNSGLGYWVTHVETEEDVAHLKLRF